MSNDINIPPKQIKYDGELWCLDEDSKLYYSGNQWLEEYCNITQCLNDEVEIIEEEKKIEKLDITKDYSGNGGMLINQMATTDYQMVQVASKINEIIDKINGDDKE